MENMAEIISKTLLDVYYSLLWIVVSFANGVYIGRTISGSSHELIREAIQFLTASVTCLAFIAIIAYIIIVVIGDLLDGRYIVARSGKEINFFTEGFEHFHPNFILSYGPKLLANWSWRFTCGACFLFLFA